jgi:hypothetical protein
LDVEVALMALTQCFLDTFTGSADTKLSAHTPDVGDGWGVTIVSPGASGDEMELNGSGQLRRQGSNTQHCYNFPMKAADAAWANDQAIEILVPTAANITTTYIFLRASSFVNNGELNGYRVNFGATNFTIRRYTGASTSVLANNISMTVADGDLIRAQAVGTAIAVYQNGNLIHSVTNSDHASGRPYFSTLVSHGNGIISSFEGLDDAGGGGGGGGVLIASCFM